MSLAANNPYRYPSPPNCARYVNEPILCEPVFAPPLPLPWYLRTVLAVVGTIAVGLLITAALLTPDQNGFGTHRQLGFPPCSFTVWFNSRCPACGMTTSWAYMTKGRPIESFRANAGGALLAITAALVGPWAIYSGVRGKWLLGPPHERFIILVAGSVLGVTLMDWSFRLLTR